MKNISLLPLEHKNYLKSERRIKTIAVVAALVVLVFVLLYATLSFSLLIPQAELDAVREERSEIMLKSAELQPYELIRRKISNTQSIFNQVMENSPDWSSLLVQIFNKINDNVWLDQFSIDYQNGAGVLTIRGWADSHSKVADWLAQLKENEKLRNVLCRFSTSSGLNGGDTVQFEISAELDADAAFYAADEGSEGS